MNRQRFDPALVEALADKEHASWSRWMNYLFSRCERGPHGEMVIHPGDVAHWQRQAQTSYADLSEGEKESDRKEVDEILPLIAASGLLGAGPSPEAPLGKCDECGATLVDHRDQCPQGEACTATGLLWCPRCRDFMI